MINSKNLNAGLSAYNCEDVEKEEYKNERLEGVIYG